jgi:hypothetical protein
MAGSLQNARHPSCILLQHRQVTESDKISIDILLRLRGLHVLEWRPNHNMNNILNKDLAQANTSCAENHNFHTSANVPEASS